MVALVTFAQTDLRLTNPDGTAKNTEPKDILLVDHLHGHWLTIGRVNHAQPGAEFNPNWTYIRCAEGIVPTMKKQGKIWFIQFDSEIAKGLP
jgi:hypothetical protein